MAHNTWVESEKIFKSIKCTSLLRVLVHRGKKGTSVKGPYLEILPHEILAKGTAVRERGLHYHGHVKVNDSLTVNVGVLLDCLLHNYPHSRMSIVEWPPHLSPLLKRH